MRISYPKLVRNEVELERMGESDIGDEIYERKCRWIVHVAITTRAYCLLTKVIIE